MLVKYSPFTDFGFRDFENSLARMFDANTVAKPWTPPVDVFETDHELVMKADAPEMKPEDIEVHFENGTLTIKGKRSFEKTENDKGYHRIERSYGSFVRAFTLPETVDPEKLTANYVNGVLTVSIGKKEIAKPRAVKVNVSAN